MAEVVVESDGRSTALAGLSRLAPWRQLALLVGLAASVAIGVSVAMWSQTPNFALLYGNLGGMESGEVVSALEQAGIQLRIDEQSGALMVPSEKVHEARIKLASLGLPRSTEQGFEVLDAEQGFGTSQFIERARFQRALEIELGRTIASLNNVQTARVHLAVPRETAFLRNRLPPTASVLVQLYSGRSLEEGQADSIAHLVAAAIPNLEPAHVRVVNERGRLLTKPASEDQIGASTQQLDYARRLEQVYAERIQNILAPVLGADALRAEVTADLDFTRVEQSRESYDPDLTALRSERVLEEAAGGGDGFGIPGAISNQPPAPGVAPEVSGLEAGGVGDEGELGTTRRSATRNYELDRVVSHTRRPGAMLRRLSVAVVIDDARTLSADGAVVTRPRTPEEIERLTTLVREAVGYDAARGDTVNVVNAAFAVPPVPEALPEQPIWEQPWVWTLARQLGGGLLVLVLAFGVLRPIMRNLVARDAAEREAVAAVERARITAQSGGEDGDEDSAGGGRRSAAAGERGDADTIRRLVQQDPKRVANVVKTWVADGE